MNNPNVYQDTLKKFQEIDLPLFNFQQPLTLGIKQQMKLWTDVKSRDLCIFLNFYCNTSGYLHCVKEGNSRVNLLGQITGRVTKLEQEIAENILRGRGLWKL